MIRHVVCFKLKDSGENAKLMAKEMLLSMIGNCDLLQGIEVGTDFLSSPRSFDLILITTFKSKADLDAYQVHPYHAGVVKSYMHAHVEKSVAVDYEF